jgi:hypothetical protein
MEAYKDDLISEITAKVTYDLFLFIVFGIPISLIKHSSLFFIYFSQYFILFFFFVVRYSLFF